jgi:hypothetical protein
MSKINSRWRKGAQRYSSKRTVESARWVKDPSFGRRLVRKMVTELLFVEQGHEPYGWRHGARLHKV